MLRLKGETRLVEWADLPGADRDAVRKITGQESVPAVLIPPPGTGTVKVIDTDLVRLVRGLPRSVPDLSVPVRALILDDILELQTASGFVSGPAAASLIAPKSGEPSALSRDAILYGASLPITSARALSARLYRYNTAPFTTEVQLRFGGNGHIAAIVGLAGSCAAVTELTAAGYMRIDHPHWLAWSRRDFNADEGLGNMRYKLYISPAMNALTEAVSRALRVIIRLNVPSFKIGRTIPQLLRPDKFVIYADEPEALDEIACALRRELAGLSAQGVPFTRVVDDSGLLSTGIDPPRSLCLSGWAQADSWRAWIADRIALALLQSRAHSQDVEAHYHFALAKLQAEGIDITNWRQQQ